MIRCFEVNDKKGIRKFIRIPWIIYKNDKNWVPPLLSEAQKTFDKKRNPYFEHADGAFFIVEKDGKSAGRIVAHIDRLYLDFYGEMVGFFGFFECINDHECARLLFDKASQWLAERGMKTIMGPFNYSTNSEVGLLVDGFDRQPVVMMTYNPPYYVELIERYGFTKAKDIYAYIIDKPEIPQRLANIIDRFRLRADFTVRKVNLKKLDREIKLIKEVYNSAWEKNWGFVPMTDKEFDDMAKNLKMIVDPDLAFIAEKDGKPIGFSLAIPDINLALAKIRSGRLFPFGIFKLLYWSKRIKRLRVLALGVVPEFRKKGVELMFYYETFKEGLRKGYNEAELSWILEDNYLMRKGIEHLGGRIYKRYRFYSKSL